MKSFRNLIEKTNACTILCALSIIAFLLTPQKCIAQDRRTLTGLQTDLDKGLGSPQEAARAVAKILGTKRGSSEFFASYVTTTLPGGNGSDTNVHSGDLSDLCESLFRFAKKNIEEDHPLAARNAYVSAVDICLIVSKLRPPSRITDALTGQNAFGRTRYSYITGSVASILSAMVEFSNLGSDRHQGKSILGQMDRFLVRKINLTLVWYRRKQDDLGGINSGKTRVVDEFRKELDELPGELLTLRNSLAQASF